MLYIFNFVIMNLYISICKYSIFFLLRKDVIITPMGKKKLFSTRIDDDRLKELKHLAVDTDKSLGTLLEEAIQDIVKKYEKKLKK